MDGAEDPYAQDEPQERPLPSWEAIVKAAVAVDRVCRANNLAYGFFGGLELVLLGSPRATKDVDVEVRPLSEQNGGFPALVNMFASQEDFRVLPGNRTDALRVIWNLQIGVDVWLRGRLPKKLTPLRVTVPEAASSFVDLPCFKPKHLLLEKIRALAERRLRSENDIWDVLWLLSSEGPKIKASKMKKIITQQEIDAAKVRYPTHLEGVLDAFAP